MDSYLKHTVEAFILSREAAVRSEATIACYRYSLESYSQFAPKWPPTTDAIRAFLADCRAQGLSPFTIYDHWARLAIWLRWLKAEGHLEFNPMDRVEQPSVPDPLPKGTQPSDVQAILSHLEQEIADGEDVLKKRDLALISFVFDTGVRNKEVRTLQMDAVYLRQKVAIVHGKGNRDRPVTFGRRAQKAMAQWLKVRPSLTGSSPYVFVTREGNPMNRFVVLRIVKQATQRAGVEGKVTPHALRHASTLGALDLGARLVDVKGQMGHHDIAVTDRYAQASRAHRRQLHEQFSPLDRLDELVIAAGDEDFDLGDLPNLA